MREQREQCAGAAPGMRTVTEARTVKAAGLRIFEYAYDPVRGGDSPSGLYANFREAKPVSAGREERLARIGENKASPLQVHPVG
jgi:hypothetical protein